MGHNDDRRRKVEAGGKGLSVTLSPEAQVAMAEIRDILKGRGEPSSKEAATCRALVWAAAYLKAGNRPSTSAHEETHEPTHEDKSTSMTQPHESTHEETHEERIAALEERVQGLEAALIHGVQPGQIGSI
ncbi:hypothetical protein [Fundidesulfovibrio magnetotacticus]|uniref:hypothetical protein n=1 Tax=Fundidesulfovibrio magnetotacticus TaxID=2730080 RepID=UPI001565EAC4|nr:hypothetical protein [Fundidesulfovibrio magnetotacticus]